MAQVSIIFASVRPAGLTGGSDKVFYSKIASSEVLDTDGSPTTAAGVATSGFPICCVTVSGGAAWIAFGENPEAGVESDWLILDGQTREFLCDPGTKVSVASAP